jgi:hypothetical protein
MFGQLWKEPAMVDMRVREQHGVDVVDGEGKVTVVEFLYRLRALEHAAVHQNVGF